MTFYVHPHGQKLSNPAADSDWITLSVSVIKLKPFQSYPLQSRHYAYLM